MQVTCFSTSSAVTDEVVLDAAPGRLGGYSGLLNDWSGGQGGCAWTIPASVLLSGGFSDSKL